MFSDVTIPSIPKPPVKVTLEDHLDYITDPEVRRTVENLLQEVREWDKDQIVTEPTIYYISMKISGKLFAALYTRRKHFIIDTSDTENEWTRYTIATNEDLTNVKALLRANTEKA